MFHSVLVMNENYSGLNPIQFGWQDCEPSHCYGPAVRPYWLIHYVRSGHGVFLREGVKYTVCAGEFFVIEPGIDAYYEADGDDPWVYTWIGFTSDAPMPVTLTPVVRCASAGRIFEKMKRCESMEKGRSAYLAGMLWQLMSAVMDMDGAGETAQKSSHDYINKAISYINTEYSRAVTVGEIAAALNLNRSYFSTLFTEQMGVSPKEYLIDLRMERAAEIMTDMGGTPATAAASVGYVDIYQFSKMFKSRYGVSPREYIKMRG